MKFKRGLGKRKLARNEFVLLEEIDYIRRRAAERDGRIVTMGQVVLFSTETGDAWLLEPDSGFAAPLAREGIPQDLGIEETASTFTIAWPGSYRISGDSFIYTSLETDLPCTILGYPIQRLTERISGL